MTETTGLRSRIIHAGSWTLFGHLTSQLIRLFSNLIMTRLLVPEMFGVMAIANIIIIGLAMFSDIGLKQNIIQSKRGEEPAFLNTVWLVQIGRGLLLSIICVFAAFIIEIISLYHLVDTDGVYSSPLLPEVLLVLALSPLIQGFESTKIALSNRGLILKRVIGLELIAQVFGLVFMLVWVYFDRSIWALVSAALFSGALKMILSHAFLPGDKNKIQWENTAFKEIFDFGKWMFLSSILGFLIKQGDKLLLGGFMNMTAFGLYSIAILLYTSIETLILKLINNVAFPALGEVNRYNPEVLRQKYYRIRLPIDLFCILMAGLLFNGGSTVVDILYDDRYSQAGPMLEVLSLLLLVIRFGVAGQFYLVMGRPKILTVLMLSRLIFMIIFIPLGYQVSGDIGAVYGLVTAYCPSLFLTFYFKKQYSLLSLKDEIKVLPVFIVGLFIGNLIQLVTG